MTVPKLYESLRLYHARTTSVVEALRQYTNRAEPLRQSLARTIEMKGIFNR